MGCMNMHSSVCALQIHISIHISFKYNLAYLSHLLSYEIED